jgi:arylsulfatase A-like enzyme
MMEVFAGFLGHTDHHLGRLLDFLRERGDLDTTVVMVISDNGTGAEGEPTGTTNEAQFFNNAQEPLEDSLAHRRDRWPDDLQPLPAGLDVGRQHPVPAVEAGDLLPGLLPRTGSGRRARTPLRVRAYG